MLKVAYLYSIRTFIETNVNSYKDALIPSLVASVETQYFSILKHCD